MLLLCRNQSLDLLWKTVGWFLHYSNTGLKWAKFSYEMLQICLWLFSCKRLTKSLTFADVDQS